MDCSGAEFQFLKGNIPNISEDIVTIPQIRKLMNEPAF